MADNYSLIQTVYIYQTLDNVYIPLHRMPLSLTRKFKLSLPPLSLPLSVLLSTHLYLILSLSLS